MRYPPELEEYFNTLVLYRGSSNFKIDCTLLYQCFISKYEYKYETVPPFLRASRKYINDKQLNSIEIETSFDKVGKRKYYFIFGSTMKTTEPITSISDLRLTDQLRVYLNAKIQTQNSDNLRPPHNVVAPGATFTQTGENLETQTPVITNPSTFQSFPLLRSLGIQPNFNTEHNCNQISNLLSELVNLHRKNNRQMHFTYTGNDKPGIVIPIPRSKDYNSFSKSERKYNWIEQIMQFVINKKHCTVDGEDVAVWLLRHLYLSCPNQFVNVAIEKGLHVRQVMNEVEAAAMWSESNVTLNQARIILRHLYHNFKTRVQVPLTKLYTLSNITDTVTPTFGSFVYKKDGDRSTKTGEVIKYWHCNPDDLLKEDFSRLLMSHTSNEVSTFGYTNPVFHRNSKGCICIIGSDHGGGSSKYVLRTNYLNSSHRRINKCIEFGTRTIQFAEIRCKKDVHQIQKKIAPVVNNTIKKLERSKLIAVKMNNNNIVCELVPCDVENIHIESDDNGTYLKTVLQNKTVQIKIHQKPSDYTEIFTVIPQFKVVIAGDLSFYATATGRDGHSHVRCTYCDLTIASWTNKTVPGTTMTLPMLQDYAKLHQANPKSDTKGVIMPPQLLVEPKFYIVPILHLLIGLVNKVWTSLCFFLDEFVELVSAKESELKEKYQLYEQSMKEIKEEIDIHTVNKNYACTETSTDPDAKIIYDSSCVQLKNLESERKILAKNMKDTKTALDAEKKKRLGDENGMDNLLFIILECSKINRQSFHGGAMNGVSCRRLLDHIEDIFTQIRLLAHQRVADNSTRSMIISHTDLDKVLDKFQNLFETLDVVFSLLRLCSPTEEEIKKAEHCISELEKKWNDLELSHTPKLHILLDHTIDQVRLFGGVADLAEDFVEKTHQISKRLDHATARMNSQRFRDKEMAKIRRKWTMTNPKVQNQITTVKEAARRKNRKDSSPRKKFKKDTVKEAKTIKREQVIKDIMETK